MPCPFSHFCYKQILPLSIDRLSILLQRRSRYDNQENYTANISEDNSKKCSNKTQTANDSNRHSNHLKGVSVSDCGSDLGSASSSSHSNIGAADRRKFAAGTETRRHTIISAILTNYNHHRPTSTTSATSTTSSITECTTDGSAASAELSVPFDRRSLPSYKPVKITLIGDPLAHWTTKTIKTTVTSIKSNTNIIEPRPEPAKRHHTTLHQKDTAPEPGHCNKLYGNHHFNHNQHCDNHYHHNHKSNHQIQQYHSTHDQQQYFAKIAQKAQPHQLQNLKSTVTIV